MTVDPPGAQEIAAELMRRRVMVDYRPGAGIRLAPHFYTTDDEIRHALEVIDELASA